MQATGISPSIAIDKTDGFLAYLSRETLEVSEITSSKSSDMNVSFPPPGNDDGDWVSHLSTLFLKYRSRVPSKIEKTLIFTLSKIILA